MNERAGVVNQALECSLAMGRSGVAQLYRTKPVLSVAVTKLLGLRRVASTFASKVLWSKGISQTCDFKGPDSYCLEPTESLSIGRVFSAPLRWRTWIGVGSLKHALSGSINLRSGSVRWGRAADNSAPLRTYNDRRRRVGALRACKPHCHGAAQLSLVGVLVYPELRRPRAPQAQANSDWS